jgi:hypothetical protein
MVSEEALEEFKKIWKEEYGTEISNADALDSATALLTMFDAIYRPIRKAWVEEYEFDQAMPTIDQIRWLLEEPEMPDKEAWRIRDEMIRLVKLYNERRKADAQSKAPVGKDKPPTISH